MPNVGDHVFYKEPDPNDPSQSRVHVAHVLRTYNEGDGEWAKNGNVADLQFFRPDGSSGVIQTKDANASDLKPDENGDTDWTGYYSTNPDGVSVATTPAAETPSSSTPTVPPPSETPN